MTQYKPQKIAGLKLYNLPKNASINHYRYTVELESSETTTFSDKKKRPFNKNNETEKIYINHSETKVCVTIYQGDKRIRSLILRHYDQKSGTLDTYNLQGDSGRNSTSTKHKLEVKYEQNAEVGWLLVKKEQTFDSLLKLVYKKVPTHSQLDIFRHANAHLSDLQDLNLNNKVKPGQIILITNKKSSQKLTEYKKLALEAEKIFQIYYKKKGFDSEFYANNFELLLDYLAFAQQVKVVEIEYRKTVEGHKDDYCGDVTFNKKVEAANAVSMYSGESKEKFDSKTVKLVEKNLLIGLQKDIDALKEARAVELKNKTKFVNPKHEAEFRRKNYHLYNNINKTLLKNFTQLHENKEFSRILKDIIKDTSGVRASNFMGGLKLNVRAMEDIAKATISLKIGGYIVLAYYVGESAMKVNGAYETGDMNYTAQVATVETMNISGGLLGGYLGAKIGTAVSIGGAIILGVATGGTAIIVIGALGAAGGAVGFGYLGNILGTKAGRAITGVCD